MPRSLSPVVLPGDPVVGLGAGTKQYIDTGLAAKVNTSLLGAVNGVAQLGAGGQVPTAQIPDVSATYLNLTGAQSASGVKTFSNGIIVPTTAAGPSYAPSRAEMDDRGVVFARGSRWGLSAYTFHPMLNNSSGQYFSTGGGSYVHLGRAFVPAGTAINGLCSVSTIIGSGTTGAGQNGFAVYEISGTTATLAASTTSDATVWTGATGWVKKAFTTPVAAQGADREVMFAHAVSLGTATPSLMIVNMRATSCISTRVDTGASTGMAIWLNGQTTWPSTVSLASANADYFYMFIGAY